MVSRRILLALDHGELASSEARLKIGCTLGQLDRVRAASLHCRMFRAIADGDGPYSYRGTDTHQSLGTPVYARDQARLLLVAGFGCLRTAAFRL
jgi:hypothetical protein